MSEHETRLLIGGEQVAGTGARLAVENPFSEQTVEDVAAASAGQSEAAIAAAREATRGWERTPAVERGEMLHEVAARLRARTDALAELMTLEGGKPLIENADEVGWTAAAFDYCAEIGRDSRQWSPERPAETDLPREETFGPVAPIVRVGSLDEAIELANSTRFGLGANIYTGDLKTMVRCMREVKAGTVWVNDPLTDKDAGPFRGLQAVGSRPRGARGLPGDQARPHRDRDRAEGVVVSVRRARAQAPRRRRRLR